jgi:hypothetical protein
MLFNNLIKQSVWTLIVDVISKKSKSFLVKAVTFHFVNKLLINKSDTRINLFIQNNKLFIIFIPKFLYLGVERRVISFSQLY